MKNNIYESKSVNRLIWIFSIPSIISLILEMMTSFIDTIFSSYLYNISEQALSSIGLITPILSIFIAIQSLYAMSTSIFIAKYLKNEEKRQNYFIIGSIYSFLVSLFVSIITFFLIDDILYLLGADGIIFELAKQYLKIQLISNIFSSIGYTFTSAIRSFGYPKQEMIITILSVFVNILCNYISIFYLKLGFKSLAISTLISEIFCFLLSLIYILKYKLINRKYKIVIKDLKKGIELFKLGFAQTFIQILGGASGFFINNSLIINEDIIYLAVWNIIQKIYSIILMPIIGITQGIRSIISYYSGHNENKNKQKTVILTIIYCFIYSLLALITIFLFGKYILYILGDIKNIYDITLKALKIITFGLPFLSVLYTMVTLLEVTGEEKSAVILILFRQIFIMIPLIYILPLILKNNELSIFLSVPISDILSFIFAFLFINKLKK